MEKKPRLIVTGASGMLGRALTRLLSEKYEVTGLSKRGLDGFQRCDLSVENEVEALFKSVKPALVIHTAAYSDVDGCERDPGQAHQSNAMAPKNLSKACAAAGIPWIHVSTDYVFDGRKNAPDTYREEDATGPLSIYGLTKLTGEFYALNSKTPCVVVRTSWLFGHDNPKTFVNWVTMQMKSKGSASVLDNQTTAPTSVKDLSQALAKIAESLLSAKDKRHNEIFHVCNQGGTTHWGIARFINDTLGLNARVDKIDLSAFPNRPAIRPRYSVMSANKFERSFGMKMRPWKESLKEYIGEASPCAS